MPTLQVRNLPDHIYRKIVERAKAKRSSITSYVALYNTGVLYFHLFHKTSSYANSTIK
jgi:hypothetical protein